jgi:predicted AAA+ superfamily ATPase
MDSAKLGDKSMIEILDSTHVNQASYTITLNKDSEMYRNMSQHDLNIQVKELISTSRSKVALYIAKAMQAFVKDGKFLIKNSYFFN